MLIGVVFSVIGGVLGGIGAFRTSRQQTDVQIELRERADKQAEAQRQLASKSEEIAALNREIAMSQTELRKKSDEVAELNRMIAATVTGGDSYGVVLPLQILENKKSNEEVYLLSFENKGNYPLYDVHIELFNPDDVDKEHRPDGRATVKDLKIRSHFDLGNIPSHGSQSFGNPFKIKEGEKKKLILSIGARNGSFQQRLIIVKKDSAISFAQKVTKIGQQGEKPKILLETAGDKFPRDVNGAIQWE